MRDNVNNQFTEQEKYKNAKSEHTNVVTLPIAPQAENTPQLLPTVSQNENSVQKSYKDYEPIHVGLATTIYNPYDGTVPERKTDHISNTVVLGQNSLKTAQDNITFSIMSSVKNPRSALKEIYNKWYDARKGNNTITVDGITYKNRPYNVELSKRVVGKVISDPNMSAEKIAVFDAIDDIIKNGEYVGSGKYIQKTKNAKDTIRFDYFETNANIGGKNFVVAFDVEVFPGANNYRTHKVINKMELKAMTGADVTAPAAVTDAGPVPTAAAKGSTPTSNVPQTPPIVNGQNEKVTKNDVPIPIKEGKPTKKETPWTQAVQDIGKNFYFKDPARVFDAAAGGRNTPLRKEIREKIEEPWLKAKEETTKSMREITNEYREKTKEHNIKSGSKESAAVQWYGEGVRVDKHGNSQEYTLEDLKKEFPEDWENIVKHERLCRKMYDDYLIRTNESLEKVYPNVLEKAQADVAWHEEEAQTLRENLKAILNVYKEETGLDVADLTNRDKISNPSATATIEKLRSYIRDKKAAYLNTLDLPAEQKRLLFAWFASSGKEQKKQRYNVVNNLSILQGDKNAVLQWLMGNKNISETQIKTIFNRK